MNILLIAGYYPPDVKGGGEISTQVLAQILSDAGCNVTVLTCSDSESREMDKAVSVWRILSPNLYWDFHVEQSRLRKLAWHALENVNLRARHVIRKCIDEIRPDIVVTSTIENFGAEAWRACRDAEVACVHVLRSYYPFCFKGNSVSHQQNCEGQCVRCKVLSCGRKGASASVNGVVAISHYIEKRHVEQRFFRHARRSVIGEPLTQEAFRSPKHAKRPSRFGYLGILSADKGLSVLARAWKDVQLPDCSLSVAGRGKDTYVRHLKQTFSDSVAFCGWVDSATFLESIDYLVVPSTWNEPFGRIVIEAFACGVPVIGSRIGGIAELVEEGQNGFTFVPGDSVDLARALNIARAQSPKDYSRMSETSRRSAERFESTLIARAHITFYDLVMRAYSDDLNRPNTEVPQQRGLV